MTGNVDDKLRKQKRKVENSVKLNKKMNYIRSHIINNLLTSFVRSVRESICFRIFRQYRPRSFNPSFDLYEKFRQIVSRTDFALR